MALPSHKDGVDRIVDGGGLGGHLCAPLGSRPESVAYPPGACVIKRQPDAPS
ncbi:hypothetical protein SLNWT_1275 [Streptomyces albus]|uniref:Uncharacterized protein n=1 Tax=Streptomyces albus (strain ATCC 21838 / DSM 41398 / FERM P-419 / JCM 4703 / NBRC 107858) TaxID=1081613 RepID=A0A0B5ESD7_STRA4|nr:hypothetical protein SLNWT_1275 [Streptomyces albus]AOU75967.1 hypothetical protein SLNHY_1276 [Streptomyces albus]